MSIPERAVDFIAVAHLMEPFDAMVVASTLPHVTVVHAEGQAQSIDEALARAGLTAERIASTRVKVYG